MARFGVALRRHPVRTGVGAALLGGLIAFVFVLFAPQDLFINTSVHEPLPVAAATVVTFPAGTSATSDAAQPGRLIPPTVLGRGRFRSGEHHTTGTASLLRLADGRRYVRLEQLSTSNGPDVRIWLSTGPSTASDGAVLGATHLDVGGLQANHGDQNYAVPAGTDLSQYRSVVIWCRRFHAIFGVAPLDR